MPFKPCIPSVWFRSYRPKPPFRSRPFLFLDGSTTLFMLAAICHQEKGHGTFRIRSKRLETEVLGNHHSSKLGAKRALKNPQQVWAIRFWLDREGRPREPGHVNLAINRELHGCDVVKIKIGDVLSGGRVAPARSSCSRSRSSSADADYLSLPGAACCLGLNVAAARSTTSYFQVG